MSVNQKKRRLWGLFIAENKKISDRINAILKQNYQKFLRISKDLSRYQVQYDLSDIRKAPDEKKKKILEKCEELKNYISILGAKNSELEKYKENIDSNYSLTFEEVEYADLLSKYKELSELADLINKVEKANHLREEFYNRKNLFITKVTNVSEKKTLLENRLGELEDRHSHEKSEDKKHDISILIETTSQHLADIHRQEDFSNPSSTV